MADADNEDVILEFVRQLGDVKPYLKNSEEDMYSRVMGFFTICFFWRVVENSLRKGAREVWRQAQCGMVSW